MRRRSKRSPPAFAPMAERPTLTPSMRAAKRRSLRSSTASRREIGAARGRRLQHRRQCALSLRRDDDARISKVWEMACLAGFLTGREAARVMEKRGEGAILFTGATASVRGGAGFARSPAPRTVCARGASRWRAKWGRRESMSRMSSSTARSTASSPANGWPTRRSGSGARNPSARRDRQELRLAVPQGRSAWTFELDLRPWTETW